jgi:dephospho-CoA kinase
MIPREPLVIGLTGNMGTGKSTAGRLFAERGFRRHDADEAVKEVLLRQPDVIAAIRARLGEETVSPGGEVQRGLVAAKVFDDAGALRWLEALLHPRLHEIWRIEFAKPGPPWIVEVPLLFEKSLENWFDFTVCVSADSELQIRRLGLRGIPLEHARQRLAKQLPLAQKCELADFVLQNDGSLSFLRQQVDWLAGKLTTAA